MPTTIDIAHQLARKGRVRQLAEDASLTEVVRRMKGNEAVGLLYDGAGWDAMRIGEELGVNPRQVRTDVARARLAAVGAECTPCGRHLEGLMTFAADAIEHSMTCAECAATRRELRAGKLALQDRWRDDGARTTPPGGLSASDGGSSARSAGKAETPAPQARHPRHEPRAPRPALDRAGEVRASTIDSEPSRPTEESSTPTEGPTPTQGSPVPTQGASTPTVARPDSPVVSLPDRTPGRTRVTSAPRQLGDRVPIPAKPPRPRIRTRLARPVRAVHRGIVTGLAMVVAILGHLPRRLVLALLVSAGLIGVVAATWDDQHPRISVDPAVSVPDALATQPAAPAGQEPAAVELAAAAAPTPSPTPTPPQTRIVPTPVPAPENPTDPTIATWQRLAQCESSGNWGVNTGNGFYGGLQFTLDSWNLVGGTGMPHEHSALEQIRRAERLLDLQGWVAWPVCSSKLGLR